MKFPFLFSLLMSAILSGAVSAADAPAAKSAAPAKTEEIILGGGCFWCTEGCYLPVKGVLKVVSGYSGGHVENPTYEQICTKTTGHAEVIKVTFDPSVVSYKQLVDLFWYAHDPTTLNRQGNDVGPQYRSVIYYTNDEQKAIAEASMKEHAKEFDSPIVTEVAPLKNFYAAEDYHQDFANKNPNQGYVCAVVKPKVEKFTKKLKELSLGKPQP